MIGPLQTYMLKEINAVVSILFSFLQNILSFIVNIRKNLAVWFKYLLVIVSKFIFDQING